MAASQVNPTEPMLADRDLGDLVVKTLDQSYGWRRVTAELRLRLGRTVIRSERRMR
jgi:hypothetical protein